MIRQFVPWRFAAALCGVAATSCGPAGTSAIPDPPPTLRQPAEYAWGDAVASADNSLARHVDAQVACGRRPSTERHYVAGDDQALVGLQSWYRKRLGSDWQPLPLAFSQNEEGFGFANGDQRFAVAWLRVKAARQVPVTVFRFEDCDVSRRNSA